MLVIGFRSLTLLALCTSPLQKSSKITGAQTLESWNAESFSTNSFWCTKSSALAMSRKIEPSATNQSFFPEVRSPRNRAPKKRSLSSCAINLAANEIPVGRKWIIPNYRSFAWCQDPSPSFFKWPVEANLVGRRCSAECQRHFHPDLKMTGKQLH